MYRILVIDDIEDHRNNLSEILTLNGYSVITAQNGKLGVEKALKEKPDLILCDIRMPELDGFGVLQILGKHHTTSDIPFLYLTALAEQNDFRKGMALGADDYISKPFEINLLLQTIERKLYKINRLRSASAQNAHFEGFVNEANALELLHNLSLNREVRHFSKKNVLFEEGDPPRYLYYIEKGATKLYKTNSEGREFIIHIAGAGEYLGYLPLDQNEHYLESAAVLETSEIRLISRDDFQKLVFGNRDVNAHFIKMLANHVAEQEQLLLDMAYNSVRKRVASTIVNLHEQNKINIHFQRNDLAAVVGTAKETLVRTLSNFKAEGLIGISNGQITILNLEKLKKMPN